MSFLISQNSKSKGLLFCGDMSSKFISKNMKNNYYLFGDAGCCIAVTPNNKVSSKFTFSNDGNGFEDLIYRGKNFYNSSNKNYIDMNGAKIFDFAIKKVPVQIKESLKFNSYNLNMIDYFVFHQANKYIINHITKKININPTKY